MRFPLQAAVFILASFPVLAHAQAAPRHTVTAGSLTLNPYHIVAVFRPVENQAVAVLFARPGGALQTIVITDTRDAAAVFNALWGNERVTKDPGDSDARPLTRMALKDSEPATPALIVNIDRVLAIRWDANRRTANVYLDMPAPPALLFDPNTNQESDSLVILNNRRQAEGVLEAYKAAVLPAPATKENK
jgi:hypothetical protein